MAETRLSDAIEPSVFSPYAYRRTTELWALYQSGVITHNDFLNAAASGGGATVNLPYWDDFASDESNVGSDNPASSSTPKKVVAGQETAVMHYRNNSWAAMNLVAAVSGSDPLGEVATRVGRYWMRDHQASLISSLRGVQADNVANDSGDMVIDIGTDAVGSPADSELVSGDAVVDAEQTMGDAKFEIVAMAVHSVVHARLQKQNLVQDIPNARGEIVRRIYMGKDLIIDDGMPAIVGTNRTKYTTVLFGSGSVALGVGSPRIPDEVDTDPAAGDGEGMETLYSRRHHIIHPRGMKFVNASVAGKSPTNTELTNAANWDRAWERKAIRLAFLVTNG